MQIDIEKIEHRYRNLAERLSFAQSEIKRGKKDRRVFKKELLHHEKARWVFAEVSKQIQTETRGRIEKLITLALRSVFEREFTFKLKLEHKANKIYAVPTIVEGGEEFTNLKEDLGGAMIDIISLSMKIVLWSMESPQRRNLFIVDEPFRFTGRLVKKAGYMLKYLAEELNFQVIIVTHDDELIEICDRVYGVRHNGKHSVVNLIKGNKRTVKRR